jgi:hypothetical protein
MALEEGVALTADGVTYLGDRQTELLLIPGAGWTAGGARPAAPRRRRPG